MLRKISIFPIPVRIFLPSKTKKTSPKQQIINASKDKNKMWRDSGKYRFKMIIRMAELKGSTKHFDILLIIFQFLTSEKINIKSVIVSNAIKIQEIVSIIIL